MPALELTLAAILLCTGLLLNTAVLVFVILRSLRAFGIPRLGHRRQPALPGRLAPAHR